MSGQPAGLRFLMKEAISSQHSVISFLALTDN
jgi:hypothetical protein